MNPTNSVSWLYRQIYYIIYWTDFQYYFSYKGGFYNAKNQDVERRNTNGEPQYTNREGVVTHIDDAGQIHGTWGGCAVIPEIAT